MLAPYHSYQNETQTMYPCHVKTTVNITGLRFIGLLEKICIMAEGLQGIYTYFTKKTKLVQISLNLDSKLKCCI